MAFFGQFGARVRHSVAHRRAHRAALLGVLMLVGTLALTGCFPSKSASTSTGSASSLETATTGVASTTPASVETVAPVAATPKPTPNQTITKPTKNVANVTHQPTLILNDWIADGGVDTLTCDYVQFLTGAAAVKAAKAHGDSVENDYYVVNDNTMQRNIPVAKNVTIVLHPGDGPQFSRTFTLLEFEELMDHLLATYKGRTYSWSSDTIYYINVKNNKITRIENQWVP
jgi:hypothetical protein